MQCMHETRAGKRSDRIGGAKVLVKSYTQVEDIRVDSEFVGRFRVKIGEYRLVWNVLELLSMESEKQKWVGWRERRTNLVSSAFGDMSPAPPVCSLNVGVA